MSKKSVSTTVEEPRTLLLSAYFAPECELDEVHFAEEFVSLINTAKIHYDEIFHVKMRQMVSSQFLTKGKLSEFSSLAGEGKFERIYCSLRLSPMQKRNLENLTNCQVFDRSDLILQIFKNAAVSAEGRLQVKMAEAELMKTRLSGQGGEMGQQQSGSMARGPGETHREYVKRFFKKEFAHSKRQLEALQRIRKTQRERRLEAGKPIFAIVGYTNAGKSSLINALTGSNTLVENKLFATLDTTTKELFIDTKTQVLISDTIGFISNIPHNLIAAFKSTLDELCYADVLLHMVDIANSAWPEQICVVNQTLQEIGVVKSMVYVFNKVDSLSPEQQALAIKQLELSDFKPYVMLSVKNRTNFDLLKKLIKKLSSKKQT